MKIQYKKLIHERMQDAPFIGALVVGCSCNLNCVGCFHEYMKEETNTNDDEEEIIRQIKSNPVNRGIILAGLEWSEQPDELVALVQCARRNNLDIMVYSGYTETEFFARVPELSRGTDMFFKFGKYDASKTSDDYYRFGVKLASTNQVIIYK